MTDFVLDNSVAMRWHLASVKSSDQRYAEDVLVSLTESNARVPNLWHLEAANVLLGAEKRGDTSLGEVERFIAQLENLPIKVDPLTANYSFTRVMALARAYKLSSYDAAYLELAIRDGLPIATLDKDLIKAAKKSDVALYLKA
ncbi:type II toxin-antitoxin system VapC family toxin [Allohahella marinimesophila]|uniref:Type II toxin-antitoxin system VapC family toxin n=1 Tax=Allohahella marinimesophila TaxID=1054972 RepID=A0ABP7NSI9_9GAMM